jgi:hypothetical protein
MSQAIRDALKQTFAAADKMDELVDKWCLSSDFGSTDHPLDVHIAKQHERLRDFAKSEAEIGKAARAAGWEPEEGDLKLPEYVALLADDVAALREARTARNALIERAEKAEARVRDLETSNRKLAHDAFDACLERDAAIERAGKAALQAASIDEAFAKELWQELPLFDAQEINDDEVAGPRAVFDALRAVAEKRAGAPEVVKVKIKMPLPSAPDLFKSGWECGYERGRADEKALQEERFALLHSPLTKPRGLDIARKLKDKHGRGVDTPCTWSLSSLIRVLQEAELVGE